MNFLKSFENVLEGIDKTASQALRKTDDPHHQSVTPSVSQGTQLNSPTINCNHFFSFLFFLNNLKIKADFSNNSTQTDFLNERSMQTNFPNTFNSNVSLQSPSSNYFKNPAKIKDEENDFIEFLNGPSNSLDISKIPTSPQLDVSSKKVFLFFFFFKLTKNFQRNLKKI